MEIRPRPRASGRPTCSWENVFRSVETAAQWGLQHRSLGIDELYWSRRHQYLTLVYQVDAGAKRRLWIGRKRTLKTLLGFFRWFGPKRSQALRFICSDVWKAYLRVVAKKAAQYERRKPRSFTPAVSSPSSPARVGCGSNEPADSARTAPSKSARTQPWAPTRVGLHPQILLRSPQHEAQAGGQAIGRAVGDVPGQGVRPREHRSNPGQESCSHSRAVMSTCSGRIVERTRPSRPALCDAILEFPDRAGPPPRRRR